ncbi:DUF2188 domain-containing protein [uncultured Chitinophaga sp.]|jgi:hypothetical protein|uniref:DUF2188 domain-containing protein n=1 Tax=uncultured Chitinophaga sp. TaxID=339340 RepID=UPI002611341D|nr:DUF2188 domain-containing protein [uncultured Chitinophaga sp.]
MKNYHLTKHGDDWRLAKEGASRVSLDLSGLNKVQATQQSAQFLTGTGSSLKIHNVNGRIQEERTYPKSMDPKKSKG